MRAPPMGPPRRPPHAESPLGEASIRTLPRARTRGARRASSLGGLPSDVIEDGREPVVRAPSSRSGIRWHASGGVSAGCQLSCLATCQLRVRLLELTHGILDARRRRPNHQRPIRPIEPRLVALRLKRNRAGRSGRSPRSCTIPRNYRAARERGADVLHRPSAFVHEPVMRRAEGQQVVELGLSIA